MPANLPPEYHQAEREYRAAKTPQEKMEALERMLAMMPHHKGTDRLRAELRTRMAKLVQEAERQQRAGGAKTQLYTVRKEGAGQAALVGLANAGKSSLVVALTGASARVAEYAHTTQLPQPAMMPFEDIHVQLVDLPPVVPGQTPGWLRGLLRQADLLLLVLDLASDPTADLEALRAELEGLRVRPVAPEELGGDDELPVLKRTLVVGNKLGATGAEKAAELLSLQLAGELPMVAVSAAQGLGLEELRRATVDALGIVRIYAKPPGRQPDMDRPFVLRRGATVGDLAEAIHHDLLQNLRYAVLWSENKPAVRVARGYVLQDRDVIELHAS